MKCPRDQHELVDRTMDDLSVHKCPDCFGLWIPMPVIISLAKAENFTSLVHIIEAGDSPITSLPLGKLACPVDDRLMHFSVIHNVELDICPSCRGVWLDRGEFDSAAFRERLGWVDRKEPEDTFLRLFIDTVAYTPELPAEARPILWEIFRVFISKLFKV